MRMVTTRDIVQEKQPVSRRSFFEHYGSTFLGQAFILGLGVITGILAARMLGPSGRGEVAAIIIWPSAIVTLLSLGINQSIAYSVGQRAFTLDEVATASVVIGLVQASLSVLLGLIIVPLALARYSPEVRYVGILFALFSPALILGGYSGNLFQGKQDLVRFNLIRVTPAFVYLAGLGVLYWRHQPSVRGVVFAQVAGFVLALAFGVALCWRVLHPHFQWSPSVIPWLLSFGWRTQITNLANTFNQRIDQMILSLFVPPQQLGFYAVAVTLSNAVTVFPQAAGIVTFSRGAGQQGDEARRTIGTSFRASLTWLLLCCTLLYLVAPFLIHVVFGARFDGSIIACRILLPGALMVGLNQVLYNGASALGRPGLPSIAEGVSMVITAVGLYILVPRYGYIGAAIVSSIAYTASFLIMLVIAKMFLGLRLRSLLWGDRKLETVMAVRP
jgi:O-antigen/teichoic acid export membrane protein